MTVVDNLCVAVKAIGVGTGFNAQSRSRVQDFIKLKIP